MRVVSTRLFIFYLLFNTVIRDESKYETVALKSAFERLDIWSLTPAVYKNFHVVPVKLNSHHKNIQFNWFWGNLSKDIEKGLENIKLNAW